MIASRLWSRVARRGVRSVSVALLMSMCVVAASADPPEELTVTGRYPGPPLWKVSAGDARALDFRHAARDPQRHHWGSVLVERVIARADEMLLPPGVDAAARNPFRYVGLFLPACASSPATKMARRSRTCCRPISMLATRRFASATTARAVSSRSGRSSWPGRLYARAIDASKLTFGGKLQSSIERLARDAHVKRTDTEVRADPGDLLDAAQALSRQAEIDCFATVLASIENDLPGIAERARAWAVGDIDALRRFDYPDIEGECLSFAGTSEGLSDTLRRAQDAWLDAAQRALAANGTTFATLGVGDLLRRDGPLARLRELGYEVREP